MIYTLVVQIIQQQGIVGSFPVRTEADLFVRTMKHQRELSEVYRHCVPMNQVTDQVVDHHAGKWPQRFLSVLKKRLLGVLPVAPPPDLAADTILVKTNRTPHPDHLPARQRLHRAAAVVRWSSTPVGDRPQR